MKTVTKAEVERVLSNYKGWFVSTKKEEILNELFSSFKAGDWVVGWHHHHEYRENAWQIGGFKKGNEFVVPKEDPNWKTGIQDIRHATPEEIAAAEWEEGKPYRVWLNGRWVVRVSSSVVSRFYIYGEFDGDTCKFDKYEKL